jgi:hypothetical protein
VQDDVLVTVYSYLNAADAIAAMKAYESVRADYLLSDDNYYFPTEGLGKVAEYKIKPVTDSSSGYMSRMYFSLPKLDRGIYLLDYTVSGIWNGKRYEKEMQIMVQVTDLRVHTESCDGKTLFWVNDISGRPVADAQISAECFNRVDLWNTEGGSAAYTKVTGKTDGAGLALLNNGDKNAAYVSISSGGDETVIQLLANEDTVQKYFCKYVYTDREVYFSDDTVNYYGVITPGGEEIMPSKLYVFVGSIPYGTIEVKSDGTFSGSLPIESYTGYSLFVKFCLADGTYVASKYIRVTQSEKPVYKASIEFDKLFYVFGDTVTATLTASFYDGTPAPGLRFNVMTYGPFGSSREVVTGTDGKASVSLKTTAYKEASSTYPMSIEFCAYLSGYETTSLSVYKSVLYFHSDVQFRSARVNADYSELYLNKTDTSKIKTEQDLTYPAFPANIYGGAAAGNVKITLYKCEYQRVSSGTYYDPITKTTYKNYYTQPVVTEIRSYSADFVSGVVRLDHIDAQNFDGYYYYTATYYDAKNNASYSLTVYATRNEYSPSYYSSWYSYDIELDKDAYSVGDTVEVSYLYNKQQVPGKILYTVYDSNGIAQQAVVEGSYKFTFTDSMALYCAVYATAMDGSRYILRNVSVPYDYTLNNTLKIQILPDSNTYAPGQKAVVTIKVADKNGNPVLGTVILGMVDEACFALGDQSLEAVQNYFTSAGGSGITTYYYGKYAYYDYYGYNYYYYGYSSPIVTVLADGRFDIFYEVNSNNDSTYRNNDYAWKAETASASADAAKSGSDNSGSDSVYIRENFSDNPVFEAIRLGSDGVAVFSFTVPDNITEWRLTALALGNIGASKVTERMLGSAVTDVICTQPYFINVSSCNYYIEGDDVTVSVRPYGTALNGVGTVTYSAEIISSDGKSLGKLSVDGKTGEYAWFNFGVMPVGTYSVTVTSRCGSYSDGVKTTFDVVESGNIVNVRKDIAIDEIKNLKPLTYPLILSFYNSSYDKYIDVVNQTRRNYYGSRSDAKAAYYAVLAASEKLFGSDGTEELADIRRELSSTGSGLIPLLEYSEGDIALTAKICAVAPEALSDYRKADIISVLNAYVGAKSYTDDTSLCAALLGLAALGEPVLDRLYYVAGGCSSFSTEAKLYLAAAFAYIGDFSAANEIYKQIKAVAANDAEGGELSIKGSNTEDSIKLTALALMTAARLSRADAEKMVKYLGSHTSGSGYYGLELAAYVKYFMPTEKVEATLTYRFGTDGEIQKVEVPVGGAYVLRLTKTGFDSLEIISVDGNIRVRAAYGGSPADALDGTGTTGEIAVTKTITPYDAKSGLYMVTLSFSGNSDRTYASFSISDCIPTGARFVSYISDKSSISFNTSSRSGGAWIYNTGGQQMSGWISIWTPYSTKWNEKTASYSFSGSVSYIIRGAVAGSFIAEEAMVRNNATGNYAVSDRMYVTIDGNYGEWVVKVLK